MVRYRRNRVPDGTFFFTVTLRDRRSDALVRHVDALRDAWRAVKARIPHEVVAVVVSKQGSESTFTEASVARVSAAHPGALRDAARFIPGVACGLTRAKQNRGQSRLL